MEDKKSMVPIIAGRLRVLIAHSLPLLTDGNPQDFIEFDEEEHLLLQRMRNINPPMDLYITNDGTTQALQATLFDNQGFDVVILSLHCRPEGCLFEDKYGGLHLIKSDQLISLFSSTGDKGRPKIVVILGCHSEGVGRALVESGIKAVIAFDRNTPLADNLAKVYLPNMLAELAHGATVQQANERGRNACFVSRKPDEKFVFTMPDGQIAEQTLDQYIKNFKVLTGGDFSFNLGSGHNGLNDISPKCSQVPPQFQPPRYQIGDPFLGRKQDIIDINHYLTDSEHPKYAPIVNITGCVGVGKTRLAAEIARWHEKRRRRNAVVWYPLDKQAIQRDLLDSLFGALEIPSGDPNTREVDALERLNINPILLILDNFEVLSGQDSESVREFKDFISRLASGPSRVIITSRHYPTFDGESTYLLKGISREDSYKLFRTCVPNRNFSEEDEHSIKQACELLGDVPLAIRLAASLLDDMAFTPPQLLQHIRERNIDLLAEPQGPSLRNLLNLSFNHPSFSDNAKSLFVGLSVFEGGADAEAISAVLGEWLPDWQNEIRDLRRRNLVSVTGQGDQTRWSFLPFIREYAEYQMKKETFLFEESILRKKYADYYCRYACLHADSDNYESLQREYRNILSGFDICLKQQNHKMIIDYGQAMCSYFLKHGGSDGKRYLEDVLNISNQFCSRQLKAVLRNALGNICLDQGCPDDAEKYFKKNLDDCQSVTKWRTLRKFMSIPIEGLWTLSLFGLKPISTDQNLDLNYAVTLHQLGNVAFYRGDWKEAESYYKKSLPLTEQLGVDKEIAANHIALGTIHLDASTLPNAQLAYEEGLPFALKAQDKPHVAAAHRGLGQIASLQRRIDKARIHYTECLKLERDLGDRLAEAYTECLLGRLSGIEGHLGEAEQHYQTSLQLAQEYGNPRTLLLALRGLGWLARQRGDLEEARELCSKSLEQAKALNYRWGIAAVHFDLASTELQTGNLLQARRSCKDGLKLAEQMDMLSMVAWGYAVLSSIATAQGDQNKAQIDWNRALQLAREMGFEWVNCQPTVDYFRR